MNIIAKKYKLTKRLGKGQFGSVCAAVCLKTNKQYAVKLESIDAPFSSLKHEATIVHYLNSQKCLNIPYIFYYSISSPYVCLVLTHYTRSLDILRDTLTIDEKIEWWNQSIIILETIHKAGIVHRDIKPPHFMKNDDGQWNLIDFGLATSFLRDQEHISIVEKDTIVGSPNYVSFYVHQGYEPVRRDDFISLIYIFWELLYGTFINISNIENSDIQLQELSHIEHSYNQELYSCKQWKRFYDMLQRLETPIMRENMFALLTHAERLQFSDKPNYAHALVDG